MLAKTIPLKSSFKTNVPVQRTENQALKKQKQNSLTQDLVIIALGSIALVGAYYLFSFLLKSCLRPIVLDCCQGVVVDSVKKLCKE